MLAKYGFLERDNPFSQMKISLDFDHGQYQEYAGDQFLLKQRILASSGETWNLESAVIYKSKINNDIITLLRVYFLTSADLRTSIKINSYVWKDFQSELSPANELLVFSFLKDSLQRQLDNYEVLKAQRLQIQVDSECYEAIGRLPDRNMSNMLSIVLEEKEILRNNLAFVEKKLTALHSQ